MRRRPGCRSPTTSARRSSRTITCALFEMGAHPFLTLTLWIAMFERDHDRAAGHAARLRSASCRTSSLPYPDIAHMSALESRRTRSRWAGCSSRPARTCCATRSAPTTKAAPVLRCVRVDRTDRAARRRDAGAGRTRPRRSSPAAALIAGVAAAAVGAGADRLARPDHRGRSPRSGSSSPAPSATPSATTS